MTDTQRVSARASEQAESPIMDLPEVADYLKVHPSTIYRLLKQHKLPMFRVGRDWKANRESIERWCKQQEQNGSSTVVR